MMFLSELLKTKRNAFLYLVILFPIFIVALFFISFYRLTLEEFYKNIMPGNDNNPWYYYYNLLLFILAIALPLVSSLITFIIKDIEDKANGWKVIFALPKAVLRIHFIKFLVISFYLFLYHAITLILTLISVYILSILKPEFNFNSYPSYVVFLVGLFVKYFLISLAIGSLTYCIIIFIRKNVVSLLLSIFLPLIGMFFTSSFNIYSNVISIISIPKQIRTRYILDYGSAHGLELTVPSDYDLYILAWVVFSWLLIYFQSKKPVINYS